MMSIYFCCWFYAHYFMLSYFYVNASVSNVFQSHYWSIICRVSSFSSVYDIIIVDNMYHLPLEML